MKTKPRRSEPTSTWRLALVGVFALALSLRVWAIVRLSRTPLLDSLRSDSEVYWAWATLLREQGWIGHNPFFLGPLYPYWLGLLQQAIGPSTIGVVLTQAVLGAAAAAFLADASRRLTSARVGIAIGLLAAAHERAIFYDTLVLTESLLFFLECLLLWLVIRWPWGSRPVGGALAAGSIIGVAAYGRGTELLLLGPLLLVLRQAVERRRQALVAGAAALGMVALLALPGMIRHRALVGEWIPYTYSGGLNFYIGNGPQANGTYTIVDVPTSGSLEGGIEGGVADDGRAGLLSLHGLRLGPAASSLHFTRRTLDSIRRDPAGWLQVMGTKLVMLFHHREIAQVESLDVYRTLVGPLGIPILGGSVVVALLGLLGLVCVRRPFDERWTFTIGYLCATCVGILLFFVVDRYRHHLTPALLLLGAATLQSLAGARAFAAGRQWVRIAGAAALAATLVFWPMPTKSSARQKWDLATRLGEAWLQKGRPDLARTHFDDAIALDGEGALPGADTPTGRTGRALAHEGRAVALWQLGRLAEAAQSFARAIEIDPQPGPVVAMLFELNVERGALEEAKSVVSRGYLTRDLAVRFLLDRARQEERRSPERVLAYLRGVTAIDSTSEAGWMALVRALLQQGRNEEARTVLRDAERSGIDPFLVYVHRALIETRSGEPEAARSWLSRVPADRLRTDPRLAATVALIRASEPSR